MKTITSLAALSRRLLISHHRARSIFTMASPSSNPTTKRKLSDAAAAPISPPPLKRKAQSSISKTAVANFFTPASQKPKEETTWTERAPPGADGPATLLVGRYEPEEGAESLRGSDTETVPRRKIAAFDLDSTLVKTASGKTFASDPTDWKWWNASVPACLRRLYRDEGYRVVILSNQGGLTLHRDPNSKGPKNLGVRVPNFKQKCAAILAQLGIPTTLYAATGKDVFRKPRPGMWREMCFDYDLGDGEGGWDVDLANSFFVGDAGGRTGELKGKKGSTPVVKDFSCSDRNFAHNVGIAYQTPEEFFLGEAPREFERAFDLAAYPYRSSSQNAASSPNPASSQKNDDGGKDEGDVLFEKKNKQDLVLFCGPPGSGKSTFFWTRLKPLGYARVNQDTLKTRARCLKATAELLDEGESVAVDNTNPDPSVRAEWAALARIHNIPIRCVWFKAPLALCEHNNAVRALNKSLNPEAREALPKLAFTGFASRFKEPKVEEGFQDVVEVEFRFRGSEDEYAIWGRYWN